MKNSINQFVKILIVLFVTSLTISCTTQQHDENQNHGDMMDDDQTEMMEGDNDYMHENEQSDDHMMNDTTTMEMNEEMRQ